MMAGSFQPTQNDINAFLSLVPDVPESEVILRLKVSSRRCSTVFAADVFRAITIMSNKLLENTLTMLGLEIR